jgi:hypothetical protein
MTAPAAAALINLLGYITGAALYAMLLVMALGRQRVASSIGVGGVSSEKTDRLPLLTALLGLTWNLGALTAFLMQGFASVSPYPLLMATAFTSLGSLPAVVVHSLMRTGDGWRRRPPALAMTVVAYGLSATAGALRVGDFCQRRFDLTPLRPIRRQFQQAREQRSDPEFMIDPPNQRQSELPRPSAS